MKTAGALEQLLAAAREMQQRAVAPYSRFQVGAAVLTDDGRIIGACNVESSSYGLTCCAERAALYRAVAEGHRHFRALAVASDPGSPPCGACRQVIWDLCGDIPIHIIDREGRIRSTSTAALLPEAFGGEQLP